MAGFTHATDRDIRRCADAAGTVPIRQFPVAAQRRLAQPAPGPGRATGSRIPEFA